MSKTISVSGLVLGAAQSGEHHKILTVLTAEYGIISVYAHGGQSIKSSIFAATNPYSYSDFELYQKGDTYTVKSASVIRNFFDNKYSYVQSTLLIYCNEVLNYVCCKDTGEDGMLRLALNIFHAVNTKKYSSRLIKGVFDMRCALIQGFPPDISECTVCGKDVNAFDLKNGCAYCVDHAPKSQDGVVPLSKACRDAIIYLLGCPSKKILSFALDGDAENEFFRICEGYLEYQLEHKFKSTAFFHQALSME